MKSLFTSILIWLTIVSNAQNNLPGKFQNEIILSDSKLKIKQLRTNSGSDKFELKEQVRVAEDGGRINFVYNKKLAPTVKKNETALVIRNIKVYPNPFKDQFIVDIKTIAQNQMNDKCVFELYNLLGQKQIQKEIRVGTSTIYRNDVADGIYFWRVTDYSGNILGNGKIIAN